MNWQVNLGAYAKKEVPIEFALPKIWRQITLKNHMLGDGNAYHVIWAEQYFIKP